MILDIRRKGDKILKVKAKPVKRINKTILSIIDNMWETMYHHNGVGLAAPQVGFKKKIIVIDTGNLDEKVVMINPKITHSSTSKTSEFESCLSIPKINLIVPRYDNIQVKYMQPDGKYISESFTGYYARVIQHEIDHLNGILITDYL